MFLFLSVSLPISVCLHIYLRAFVYLDLSVSQSVCLSVVRRSVVGLPQLSINHGPHQACRQRRGDAESERAEGYAHKSNRLRTQERQVGLMNDEAESREAESRGLRARS